jgi:hypothetical protein
MSIYATGGKPILKDGKVATGSACCCDPPPPKRYTCRQRSCENPLDCPSDCVEDPYGEYDEPTCGGNCEPPPDPCTVLVDGVRVPVASFDPYEVIAAKWRGLQTPGSDRLVIDGVLVADTPTPGGDSLTNITRAGCDGAGQTVDTKQVALGPTFSGIISACFTTDAVNKHITLSCERVDDITARLHGGVVTVKIYTTCDVGGAPSGDSIQEENWWLWECLLVDGVPGEVKVTPSIGARYFNSEPVECVVTHEAPEVTLDFVP